MLLQFIVSRSSSPMHPIVRFSMRRIAPFGNIRLGDRDRVEDVLTEDSRLIIDVVSLDIVANKELERLLRLFILALCDQPR